MVLSSCLRTLRAILSGLKPAFFFPFGLSQDGVVDVSCLLDWLDEAGLDDVLAADGWIGLPGLLLVALGTAVVLVALATRGAVDFVAERTVVALVLDLAAAKRAARLASCSFMAATARICPGRRSNTCGRWAALGVGLGEALVRTGTISGLSSLFIDS